MRICSEKHNQKCIKCNFNDNNSNNNKNNNNRNNKA